MLVGNSLWKTLSLRIKSGLANARVIISSELVLNKGDQACGFVDESSFVGPALYGH
jgi:hypothetical protein